METQTQENVTYLYGDTVALEPGEAAPPDAKHEDIAHLAGWHVRDLANGTRPSRTPRTFSTPDEPTLHRHPDVKAARALGEALIREVQTPPARLAGAAKSKRPAAAARILDAVRAAVQS
jgi:hypothetical protein